MRGRVEEVEGDMVELLLLDWGHIVTRHRAQLKAIPSSIKQPRRNLANKLMMLNGKEMSNQQTKILSKVLSECQTGILTIEASDTGDENLNGKLKVKFQGELRDLDEILESKNSNGSFMELNGQLNGCDSYSSSEVCSVANPKHEGNPEQAAVEATAPSCNLNGIHGNEGGDVEEADGEFLYL